MSTSPARSAVDATPRRLPLPPTPGEGVGATVTWVADHLADVVDAPDVPLDRWASTRFRGGQRAADAALAALDLTGYADTRSEVLPRAARGATGLSPFVRHGLLDLPRLWRAAADAPGHDRDRFRDELLWQEYARHVYARLGARTRSGLRHEPAVTAPAGTNPWVRARAAGMACLDAVLGELDDDGWLVNQTRMWVAAHWSVRHGADWREGEDRLYRELVDGSRAANRAGWQWTVGAATGRPYAFSRWQVERRAPELCRGCALAADCPIEDRPAEPVLLPVEPEPRLRHDPDPEASAGPRAPEQDGTTPEAVWLTAESLGDADPALAAHPGLPAVFVLDDLGRLESLCHEEPMPTTIEEVLADARSRR